VETSRPIAQDKENCAERAVALPRNQGQSGAGGLPGSGGVSLGRQVGRLNLPRYFITWSGHVQACVQGWPSRNRGVFPAVDHDRSRT